MWEKWARTIVWNPFFFRSVILTFFVCGCSWISQYIESYDLHVWTTTNPVRHTEMCATNIENTVRPANLSGAGSVVLVGNKSGIRAAGWPVGQGQCDQEVEEKQWKLHIVPKKHPLASKVICWYLNNVVNAWYWEDLPRFSSLILKCISS